MKNIIIGIVISGIIFALIYYFFGFKTNENSLANETGLIQQQIKNVGKLVVTEGHFSEVLTYKDQDSYLGGLVSFKKKALIIVNADVSISYDLHLIKYDIDEKNKQITIANIPNSEVKISPNIKFYDVDQSKLNPFTGDDYNKINAKAKESIAKKIEKSTLVSNAENRLIAEISKMLILTNSMGWKLIYKGNEIKKESDLTQLKL